MNQFLHPIIRHFEIFIEFLVFSFEACSRVPIIRHFEIFIEFLVFSFEACSRVCQDGYPVLKRSREKMIVSVFRSFQILSYRRRHRRLLVAILPALGQHERRVRDVTGGNAAQVRADARRTSRRRWTVQVHNDFMSRRSGRSSVWCRHENDGEVGQLGRTTGELLDSDVVPFVMQFNERLRWCTSFRSKEATWTSHRWVHGYRQLRITLRHAVFSLWSDNVSV